MSTTKVSALAEKTNTNGNEELLINDGGTSKKVLVSNLLKDDGVLVKHLELISTTSVPSLEAKGTTGSTSGYIKLNCSENSHGIKLLGPPHSAGANYTLTFPDDDGSANQKLTTNGSGVLTWTADANTVYTHPNHSGEVTSTADGATVIADNIVDEANLKISNTPTNGYVLTAQSSNAGGLTWAADNNTVYTHPNHSGEVTSTADGATVIASNVVDEANLKVSNNPTNGYVLSAQSGATGGMTWAASASGLPSQSGNSGKFLTTDATNASWAVLDTDANTTTKGLYEMKNVISANYSIASGNNAMSAGPITINSNISVTVPSGSTWVIA